MAADVTVCIPVGMYHQDVVKKAVLSAQMQTERCEIITYLDKESKGPGVCRNMMAERVKTPFIMFLDADDELMPTCVEEMHKVYKNNYIYSDWFNDAGLVTVAPDCAWVDGKWHIVTALIPMQFFTLMGGFNINLPALEDTDLFTRMALAGLCGRRLAMPLVKYSSGGKRSVDARANGTEKAIKEEFTVRYGGRRMSCCGEQQLPVIKTPAGKMEGDVLAQTLWGGNHSEMGRVTRRVYPRSGNGQLMYVSPLDVRMSPHLWREVEEMAEVVVEKPPAMTEVKPNFSRVINVAKFAMRSTEDPVFALPDIVPDSYKDLERLIKVSGYKSVSMSLVSALDTAPLIVCSPFKVPLHDIVEYPRRVIVWQLEYAGDYIHNYDGFSGEVWASDAAWAKKNNAKYVMMGSHADLVLQRHEQLPKIYDVTMLGYMIPRRQAIKDQLSTLKWPIDYPGHTNLARDNILPDVKLMLHVHQHNGAPYVAPQRMCIAAAYHMPVLAESFEDVGPLLGKYITTAPYNQIPATVVEVLKRIDDGRISGESLHQFLCVQNPFRKCVEEALK